MYCLKCNSSSIYIARNFAIAILLIVMLVSSQFSLAFGPAKEDSNNSTRRSSSTLFVSPIVADGNTVTGGNTLGSGGSCKGTQSFLFALSPSSCNSSSWGISNLSIYPSSVRPYERFYVSFCVDRTLTYVGLEFFNPSRWDSGRVQLFYDYAAGIAGCQTVAFSGDNSDIGNISLNVYGVDIDYWGSWNWTDIQTTYLNIHW